MLTAPKAWNSWRHSRPRSSAPTHYAIVPAGCYTMATHSCDCSTPEEDCLAGNVEGERPAYYWTESCLGTDGELCSHEVRSLSLSRERPARPSQVRAGD